MSDPKQTALKAKITRLRNASKKPGLTLAEKLERQKQAKDAAEELRLYRLNIRTEAAYERSRPKRAKAVAKGIDNMAREMTREQLRAACKKPPAEFQSWGHTRTMAWLATAKRGNSLVRQKRPSLSRLLEALRAVTTVHTASLDACQQIINPPKK